MQTSPQWPKNAFGSLLEGHDFRGVLLFHDAASARKMVGQFYEIHGLQMSS